jgi:hypothetical protein
LLADMRRAYDTVCWWRKKRIRAIRHRVNEILVCFPYCFPYSFRRFDMITTCNYWKSSQRFKWLPNKWQIYVNFSCRVVIDLPLIVVCAFIHINYGSSFPRLWRKDFCIDNVNPALGSAPQMYPSWRNDN